MLSHLSFLVYLSISIFLLALQVLITCASDKNCLQGSSCASETIFGSDHSLVLCEGYLSCDNATILGSSNWSYPDPINTQVMCEGSHACVSADINLTNPYDRLWCSGDFSCAFATIQGFVSAIWGNYALYKSNIVALGNELAYIHAMGHASLSHANMSLSTDQTFFFWGYMSGESSFISSNYDVIRVDFNGGKSGSNAIIQRNSGHTCYIGCYGDACNNLTVSENGGAVHVTCMYDAVQSDLCPDGRQMSSFVADFLLKSTLNADDSSFIYDQQTIDDSNLLVSLNDPHELDCSGNNTNFLVCQNRDDSECQQHVHSSLSDTILCCLGERACRNADLLPEQSTARTGSLLLRCGSRVGCVTSELYQTSSDTFDNSISNVSTGFIPGNIYSTAYESLLSATVSTSIQDNLFCASLSACDNLNVLQTGAVYCVAYYSCERIKVNRTINVHAYAHAAMTQGEIVNLVGSLTCSSTFACGEVRVQNVGGSVLAQGYVVLQESVISDVSDKVVAFGYQALYRANISNSTKLYCDGTYCLEAASVSTVQQIVVNGTDCLKHASITSGNIANTSDVSEMSLVIYAENSDPYQVVCSEGDTCVINCAHPGACTQMKLYCYGTCFVDCTLYADEVDCPTALFGNFISADATTSAPTLPTTFPTFLPTTFPTSLPTTLPTTTTTSPNNMHTSSMSNQSNQSNQPNQTLGESVIVPISLPNETNPIQNNEEDTPDDTSDTDNDLIKKWNDAATLVTIGGFIVACLVSLIAFCDWHCKGKYLGDPRLFTPIFFFAYSVVDIWTDLSLCMVLYLEQSNLFIISFVFFVFPYGLSCVVCMTCILQWSRWQQDYPQRITRWLSRYEGLLIVFSLFGGFYASVDLFRSKLFHFRIWYFPLKNDETRRLTFLRAINNLLCENIPQFCVQMAYLYECRQTNGEIKLIPIVIIAIVTSSVSIIYGILKLIKHIVLADMCKNPKNRYKHETTICIKAEVRFVKSARLSQWVCLSHKKFSSAINQLMSTCAGNSLWTNRSDVAYSIECYHVELQTFYSQFSLCLEMKLFGTHMDYFSTLKKFEHNIFQMLDQKTLLGSQFRQAVAVIVQCKKHDIVIKCDIPNNFQVSTQERDVSGRSQGSGVIIDVFSGKHKRAPLRPGLSMKSASDTSVSARSVLSVPSAVAKIPSIPGSLSLMPMRAGVSGVSDVPDIPDIPGVVDSRFLDNWDADFSSVASVLKEVHKSPPSVPTSAQISDVNDMNSMMHANVCEGKLAPKIDAASESGGEISDSNDESKSIESMFSGTGADHDAETTTRTEGERHGSETAL